MLSSPPATITSASPVMMRCAAIAMVCRPEEQKRFTVTPETVTGRPARMAASRATLLPVAFSGVAQPSITSSTSPGSIPARSTACLITCPPSVAPCVTLNAPRNALPIGVRAVVTITASDIPRSLKKNLRRLYGRIAGERAAFIGKLVQQSGRLVAPVAAVRRELLQPVADLGEPDAVGPVHRAAAPGRKAVAVEPDHVDIA